ncbi:cAMP-binding protein [Labilithrix luteola]|uniref:cAMP-binding protein n=1 Tax=Labilithrix luteola TaxID=1391654 RepID=A0A0K1PRW9_9BACT|nr:cyclic nucleotide-binding domain-containing protein [Labilithrix luteola]AKU96257.1 cAMP-binding protein [Labilithrix luteola]
MEDLERALRTHPFLLDLHPDHLRFLISCAENVRFRRDEYLVREGQPEDKLYLLRQGTVSLESSGPGGDATVLETLGPGDVVGIARIAPAAAHLDCRAREGVLAFAFDNACLIQKMQEDPRLGYAVTRRLLERTYERLARARLQRLDVYR